MPTRIVKGTTKADVAYRIDPVSGYLRPEVVLTTEDGTDAAPASGAQLPASLGGKTAANSLSVTPATDAVFPTSGPRGAANSDNSQVALSTTAATLAIARPTRRELLIKNIDSSITIYIGKATVTAANGMPLLAGESMIWRGVGLVQGLAASGTPNAAIVDAYD